MKLTFKSPSVYCTGDLPQMRRCFASIEAVCLVSTHYSFMAAYVKLRKCDRRRYRHHYLKDRFDDIKCFIQINGSLI